MTDLWYEDLCTVVVEVKVPVGAELTTCMTILMMPLPTESKDKEESSLSTTAPALM